MQNQLSRAVAYRAFLFAALLGCNCQSSSNSGTDGAANDVRVRDARISPDTRRLFDLSMLIDRPRDQVPWDSPPPSPILVIWDRMVAQNAAPPTDPVVVAFDGNYFAHATVDFFRYDTEAKVINQTPLPDWTLGIGLGPFVVGSNGYAASYVISNGVGFEKYFGTLAIDGTMDLAKGVKLGYGNSPAMIWSPALGQYLVYMACFSSSGVPPQLNHWLFDGSGNKLSGPEIIDSLPPDAPFFFGSFWIDSSLVLVSTGAKFSTGGKRLSVHFRVLSPPYSATKTFDVLPPEYAIGYDSDAVATTDSQQIFVAWRGGSNLPLFEGGIHVSLAALDGTVTANPPLMSTDSKYQYSQPSSATYYKEHFVMVGQAASTAYITVYDKNLKQVLPPTDFPFPKRKGYLAGTKIFADGDDLLLIYGWESGSPFDLYMMRFRIKGI